MLVPHHFEERGFKLLSLILLAFLQPLNVWSGEVIPLANQAKKKSCSTLLSQSGGRRSATILSFDHRDPDYLESSRFIEEMKSSEPHEFYLYSSDHVSFSRRSESLWRPIPQVSDDSALYVLKVRAFDPLFQERFEQKERWTVSELRELTRFIHFTRVRISPFFPLIKSVIQQVRGLESHYSHSQYVAPRLMDEYAVSGSNLKASLIAYINSWTPTSTNEEAAKELMKSFVQNSLHSFEEKQALQIFNETLEEFVEGLRFL